MSRWTPTAIVMLAAMTLQIWGVSDATAQVTAYLLTPAPRGCQSGCTGTIAAVDVDGRQVRWTAPIPAAFDLSYGGVYTTPDGRYVAWQGHDAWNGAARYVGIFDVSTRTAATIALSTPATGGLPAMIGNPVRAELYTVDASGPVVLSPAGIRPLTCATCGGAAFVGSVSANGRRVMYVTSSATVVFDTATGAVVSELVLPVGSAALSRTGDEIYLAYDTLRRHRATDGQLLAEVTLPVGGHTLRIDPRTGDVFLERGGTWLTTYAETSLAQRLAQTFVPWWQQYSGGYTWTFDPNTSNVYVTSTFFVELFGQYNQIVVFDGTTSASVLALSQPASVYDDRRIFAPAPRPAAPGPLVSSVQGGAVSLLWSPGAGPATTTRYVLEVGSAPGLSDIFTGLDVGLQASFAASGVPPGRYYVRVRAGNYTGLSAPSNEVMVQVP